FVFDARMWLPIGLASDIDRPDIERGMRPGRLRQILDDAGNPVVAFDQQHVARLDDAAEMFGIAWRKRLVARNFLLQVARDPLADSIEHYAHTTPPAVWNRFFPPYHGRKLLQFSSSLAEINHH